MNTIFSTGDCKRMQLIRGAFQVGSGDKKILIMGSCRSVPYLNYLNYYNEISGNPFTLYYIDCFNWNWDVHDNLIDGDKEREILEEDESLLSLIASIDIFIHEHYESFGMFNTAKDSDKNIYKFGMKAPIDISIPNWHDHFILFNDFAKFSPWKEKFELCNWEPDDVLKAEIYNHATRELVRFDKACMKSSFPEFADYFRENWKEIKFFHTFNHTSKNFTLQIFKLMNDKFLKLPLTLEYWSDIQEDLFENTPTPLCEYDIELFNMKWVRETPYIKFKKTL